MEEELNELKERNAELMKRLKITQTNEKELKDKLQNLENNLKFKISNDTTKDNQGKYVCVYIGVCLCMEDVWCVFFVSYRMWLL